MKIVSGTKGRLFRVMDLIEKIKQKKVLIFDLEDVKDLIYTGVKYHDIFIEYQVATFIEPADVSIENLTIEGLKLFQEFQVIVLIGDFKEVHLHNLSVLEQLLKVKFICTVTDYRENANRPYAYVFNYTETIESGTHKK